ncbi:MAG: DUF1963 domain-containing protein [Hyphomicrobiaceae bacterium]
MDGKRILSSEFSFVFPAELDFIQPIARETFAARRYPVVADGVRLVASVDELQSKPDKDPFEAHLAFMLDAMATNGIAGKIDLREEISLLDRRGIRLRLSGEWNNEAAQIVGPFQHLFVLAAAGAEGRLLRFSAGFRPQDEAPATQQFDAMLASLEVPSKKVRDKALDKQLADLASEMRVKMAAQRELEAANADEREAEAVQTVKSWARLDQSYEEQVSAFLTAIGMADKAEALSPFFTRSVLIAEGKSPAKNDIGNTRMGGGPDLAVGVDWPRNASGLYYNFLAQIDLAALPWRDQRLPADGLVSIFNDTDQTTGPVLYTPRGAKLVAHALPANAWEETDLGHEMITWSTEENRMVLRNGKKKAKKKGLVAEVEAGGCIAFSRDGSPVKVLADVYGVTGNPRLGVVHDGFTLDLNREKDLSAAASEPDSWVFVEGNHEQFKSFGNVHRLLGFIYSGGDKDWTPAARALKHAEEMGWSDLIDPTEWFVLIELVSGGEVDFNFGDYGSYVVVANKRDTAKGDFSRCFGFVESS